MEGGFYRSLFYCESPGQGFYTKLYKKAGYFHGTDYGTDADSHSFFEYRFYSDIKIVLRDSDRSIPTGTDHGLWLHVTI